MRFSLRSLFGVMTYAVIIAAIVVGFISWVRNLYYVQVRTVTAVLAEYPEIDRVWIGTNDDVSLEVQELYFSVVGEPNLSFGVYGIDGASKSTIRQKLDDALREKRPKKRPTHVYRLLRD